MAPPRLLHAFESSLKKKSKSTPNAFQPRLHASQLPLRPQYCGFAERLTSVFCLSALCQASPTASNALMLVMFDPATSVEKRNFAPRMTIRPPFLFLLLACLTLLASCKSAFEKVRTSGDPEVILVAADKYYEAGKFAKAQVLYTQVIGVLRADPRIQQARYRHADTYFQTKDYTSAAFQFRNYADNYKVAENRGQALYMEAMSYVKLSPDFKLDQGDTEKAITALEEYINLYPDTERLGEINTILADLRIKQETKAYEAALLYFDMKQYQSAVQAFERVLQDYPDSDRTEEIRFRIVESYIRLADNSVIARRRERYEFAVDNGELYLKKYPSGGYARQTREELLRIRKLLKENDDYVRY